MQYQPYEFDSLDLDPNSPFFWDHLSRYWWAGEKSRGLSVLDCACGKGYGSYILSHQAKSIAGVDLNENSLKIAAKNFKKENLSFHSFDVTKIQDYPLPLDMVVAFEVIEHLPPNLTETFLGGIAKKLQPNGTLLLSTPNHDVVEKSGVYVPDFHINNLRPWDLKTILERHFHSVTMLGQFQKRSFIYEAVFTFDYFNLRHLWKKPPSKHPEKSSIQNTKVSQNEIHPFLEKYPEQAKTYRFSPWHWRQAGLTVAICKEPKIT
jgi:2-polyprenyl-3-methyl-5-hydroxy-6-metoxy-1,4-benzoquinol methylase